MNEDTKKELQSATFERLLKHLDERKDVQNIDIMNLAGFVEIVCLDGIEKKLRKKIFQFPTLRLVNMFMVCPTLSGKRSIKNNYFSFSLGNNSTKLHGL